MAVLFLQQLAVYLLWACFALSLWNGGWAWYLWDRKRNRAWFHFFKHLLTAMPVAIFLML